MHKLISLFKLEVKQIEAELERVRSLSVEQLDELSEALLDFTSVTDLTDWLSNS